jgi:hypothetical protein
MSWEMNNDNHPVDDLGGVGDALRHELQGRFVPFDGARAEEMIEAATRAEVSRLPRLAAPLGTAAAVLAVGAGVAVFAANGSGDNATPAGGPPPTPKPTTHASCVALPAKIPPRLSPMWTIRRSAVVHHAHGGATEALSPPRRAPQVIHLHHSALRCLTAVPCPTREPPHHPPNGRLRNGEAFCVSLVPSPTDSIRTTLVPPPPPITAPAHRLPTTATAHRLNNSPAPTVIRSRYAPPPGPVTASGSPAAS